MFLSGVIKGILNSYWYLPKKILIDIKYIPNGHGKVVYVILGIDWVGSTPPHS